MNTKLKIEPWYGPRQRFGHWGTPQRWVNVLGRVSPSDAVESLTYSLNGAVPRPLSVGADKRRLAALGDFNIDLDIRDLQTGENRITITAAALNAPATVEEIVLIYEPASVTLPFEICWQDVDAIQAVAHVADGRWSHSAAGLSPDEIGYDRTVTFGEMSWRDYEVVVPVTVHSINAGCYQYPSWHAGVGVVMRWKGHANWGSDGWASGQPVFGPSPFGAIGWYCIFQEHGAELNFFDSDFQRVATTPRTLEWHRPYCFKVRVTTVGESASRYMMKVWPQDEDEPHVWDLETVIEHIGYKEGSVLLVAHHVAATFGDITVRAA